MSCCSAHWHTTTQERRPCEVVAKNLANSIRQAEAAWNGLHTAWARLKTKAVWPNQNIAINITKHLSISFNIYQKCKRCQIMSKKSKTCENSSELTAVSLAFSTCFGSLHPKTTGPSGPYRSSLPRNKGITCINGSGMHSFQNAKFSASFGG